MFLNLGVEFLLFDLINQFLVSDRSILLLTLSCLSLLGLESTEHRVEIFLLGFFFILVVCTGLNVVSFLRHSHHDVVNSIVVSRYSSSATQEASEPAGLVALDLDSESQVL